MTNQVNQRTRPAWAWVAITGAAVLLFALITFGGAMLMNSIQVLQFASAAAILGAVILLVGVILGLAKRLR